MDYYHSEQFEYHSDSTTPRFSALRPEAGECSLLTPPPSGHREDGVDQAASGGTQPQAGSSHFESDNRPIGSRSPSDIIFVSTDFAYFHAHSKIILDASHNAFNHLLPIHPRGIEKARDEGYFGANPLFAVPETSMVFNIIIHTIYRVSCAHYHPAFHDLTDAVSALHKYGIDLGATITPTSSLFNLLLSHAPDQAFDIYALASQYELYDLAVSASAYLRTFPLCNLTDEMIARVSAVYVKKLFFMHLGRVEALKLLLFPPPHSHESALGCRPEEREAVKKGWTMAAITLAWNPDVGS
ncbi:hypothetical protein HWV62_22984 [Athelia sp. TMB]|nr:hypothetical protein HWV62_22984 [Athelia sp. TMB]